ncbi:GNAT family N-acetyltransferase [Streptomyces resistomycificus]|uniref:GNAT family N-acetyltransferase n=1 Tax=Streptomyces resistomycificus TaxID=67356 RepID=UPI000689DCCC|nr:GNAT family N-acetyltransferase [Streptomyces resistomycificus]
MSAAETSTPVVRAAVPEDVDELIRLRALLLEDPASAAPYAAGTPEQSAAWRGRYRAWLADRLGTAADVRVAVVPGPGRLRALQSVVTDPRDRGRGLGAAVLDDLARWLQGQGADEIVLQTTPTATEFYRHRGFRPTGEDLLFKPLPAPDAARPAGAPAPAPLDARPARHAREESPV